MSKTLGRKGRGTSFCFQANLVSGDNIGPSPEPVGAAEAAFLYARGHSGSAGRGPWGKKIVPKSAGSLKCLSHSDCLPGAQTVCPSHPASRPWPVRVRAPPGAPISVWMCGPRRTHSSFVSRPAGSFLIPARSVKEHPLSDRRRRFPAPARGLQGGSGHHVST